MFGTSTPDLPFDAPELQPSPEATNLICVCCNCDRVRSRLGEWRDDHTPVAGERHTHGICPDCFDTLYPEYAGLAAH
jgi:hypothetical protein